jgi:hypothetical protein
MPIGEIFKITLIRTACAPARTCLHTLAATEREDSDAVGRAISGPTK